MPINQSDVLQASFATGAKAVMTSFDLQAIVKEFESIIIGSKIENIYQFSPLAILISFHPSGNLILEAGRRIHLTHYFVDKPNSPSLFCSILRRHLKQGRLDSVQVENFERVVRLKINSYEGSRSLIVETFGGGNILLLNEKDAIIQALTYRRMKDRNIIRGETYKLPPPRGISLYNVTPIELSSILIKKGSVAGILGRTLSVGSPYVEEILLIAGIEKNLPVSTLNKDNIHAISSAVTSLVNESKKSNPRIILDKSNNWLDVVPFSLIQYISNNSIEFANYNDAADVYFTKFFTEIETMQKNEGSDRQVEEQQRILEQQKVRLKELEAEASISQRIGDLLYIHFYEVQSILNHVCKDKIELEVFPNIVSIDLPSRKVRIKLEDQEIDLDLRFSVYENSKNYYELAKSARQKIDGLKQATELAEKKYKAQEIKTMKIGEQYPRILREKAWYEKFRWAKSKKGTLIIGGRDATTNEILIKKHMESSDLVLHSDTPGAPFVLVKFPDAFMDEEDITEAAQMAASYSSAWKAQVTSTNVYWVKPEQISKEAPTGEYLSRGAFMIRGQKNYVRNVQLRISIGVIETPEGLQVIGGPPNSIKAQAKLVVDIIPGRLSSGFLAKEIRKRLIFGNLELKSLILAIPLEEIQHFIPPGGGEIMTT